MPFLKCHHLRITSSFLGKMFCQLEHTIKCATSPCRREKEDSQLLRRHTGCIDARTNYVGEIPNNLLSPHCNNIPKHPTVGQLFHHSHVEIKGDGGRFLLHLVVVFPRKLQAFPQSFYTAVFVHFYLRH